MSAMFAKERYVIILRRSKISRLNHGRLVLLLVQQFTALSTNIALALFVMSKRNHPPSDAFRLESFTKKT